jgi:hypothetical protein
VKHQHILTITALTLALLSACGTTQPTLSQLPQGLPTGVQTAPSNNGRLGARAITNLLQETSLSAWGKKANVTLTDLNGFTKVGITDATTGWTGRAIPNSSAGDTYTATLEVKGTGTIQLFLQKGGGDFAQYTNKNITLSGTATTVTITTLKPADGFALQVGMTNITSGSNLEARNLVVTKGVADTTGGGTTTPVTVAALSSWAKGAGVSVVDNGDTFYKITTTSASFVNTPVTVIAGQTYRYSATFKGTGSVNLFWQQRGGAYTQYAEKTFSLSGKAQTITFDTVIPSDGAPAQIGIGSIATTDTVYVEDVRIESIVVSSTPPVIINPPPSDFMALNTTNPLDYDAFGGLKTSNECRLVFQLYGSLTGCQNAILSIPPFSTQIKIADAILKPTNFADDDAAQMFPVELTNEVAQDPGLTFRIEIDDGTQTRYITAEQSVNYLNYVKMGIRIMRPYQVKSSYYFLGDYRNGVYSYGLNYEWMRLKFVGYGTQPSKVYKIRLLAYSKDFFLGVSNYANLTVEYRGSSKYCDREKYTVCPSTGTTPVFDPLPDTPIGYPTGPDEGNVKSIVSVSPQGRERAAIQMDIYRTSNPGLPLAEYDIKAENILTAAAAQYGSSGLTPTQDYTDDLPTSVSMKLNGAEKRLCNESLANCLAMLTAVKETYRFIPIYFGWQLESVDNEKDAFRHTTWNTLMSSRMGWQAAKRFADAHEYGATTQVLGSIGQQMDYFNNQEGRLIALPYQYRGALNDQSLADLSKIAVKSTRLRIVSRAYPNEGRPSGSTLVPSNTYSQTWPPQF